MNLLKEQRNRGYVIAGVGGIVAFISFFLPYVSVSVLGATVYSASGSTIASIFNGLLWFELLASLVAIAVPIVLIYRSDKAFGLTNMPLEKQVRYGIFGIIGAGALGLLAELIVAINLSSYLGQYNGSSSPAGIGMGFGYWLYLLSAIAIVVGGIMAYRSGSATGFASSAWQYPVTQYPPYSQPSSSLPQTQYPPYGQPYPTGDQPPPYPPYQYPTGDQQQYLPTELKQPYPQTGPNPSQYGQQQYGSQQWDPTELRPNPQTGPNPQQQQQFYPPMQQPEQQQPPYPPQQR
jgi:hypothetical protein